MTVVHKESTARELFETGTEPEFVISDISKYEQADNGLLRLYVTSRRAKFDRVEYTVLLSPDNLARIGRFCLFIAAEAHTMMTLGDKLT